MNLDCGELRPFVAHWSPRRLGKLASLQATYDQASPVEGSPAEAYFAARRLYAPFPSTVRYAARLWRNETRLYEPAVLCAISMLSRAREITGIMAIYLRNEPRVLPTKILVGGVGGGVLIGPVARSMIIGRSLKHTLAAAHSTGRAAVATLTENGAHALDVPGFVQRIDVIYDPRVPGDRDRAAILLELTQYASRDAALLPIENPGRPRHG